MHEVISCSVLALILTPPHRNSRDLSKDPLRTGLSSATIKDILEHFSGKILCQISNALQGIKFYNRNFKSERMNYVGMYICWLDVCHLTFCLIVCRGVATVGPGRACPTNHCYQSHTPTVDPEHSGKLLPRNDFVMCSEKYIAAS